MTQTDPVEQLAVAGRRGVRMAVAESLTCGRLTSAVGCGEEAGTWFTGGVVAYHLDTKVSVLGVRPGVDPCSAECATQMAVGVRWLLSADVAVSTTGVGGPDSEDGHPPGTVFLGWATAADSGCEPLSLSGDPDDVLDQTVAHALAMLARRATDLAHPHGLPPGAEARPYDP